MALPLVAIACDLDVWFFGGVIESTVGVSVRLSHSRRGGIPGETDEHVVLRCIAVELGGGRHL